MALLGCSEASLVGAPPTRAPEIGLPAALPAPVPVIAETVDAVDLIADADGLTWLSSTDELWTLPTGAAGPRRLSAGGGEIPGPCGGGSFPARLATTATDVFWIGRRPSALRRTAKDGSADVILANGLSAPATIAVDDLRVYWSENTNPGTLCQGDGLIRTLPQTAAPDTTPTPLIAIQGQDVAALAVEAGILDWAAFDAPGSTVYQGAWLRSSPVAALLPGGEPTALGPTDGSTTDTIYALVPSAGTIYAAYFLDRSTTALAEIGGTNGPLELLSLLPADATLTFVAVVDRSWLAVTASLGTNDRRLYIAPITGGRMVLAAVGLATAAVAGPTGPTFVDTSGHLVALAPAAFAPLTLGPSVQAAGATAR
jgi:hypothetical protein